MLVTDLKNCRCFIVTAYTQIPVNDAMMLVLGFPLGFFASGVFSGMGPFLTELFPTRGLRLQFRARHSRFEPVVCRSAQRGSATWAINGSISP